MLSAIRAPTLVVSFSNEGFLSPFTMEEMLSSLGDGRASVATFARDGRRYVGAQIGIYNPQGRKVGTVSHLSNTEYLYLVRRR